MPEAKFQFDCPLCKQGSEVPVNWRGKRRPCPQCHEWVSIPEAQGAAKPAVAASAVADDEDGDPGADAAGHEDAPLSFAERMKQAAERGSSAIRQKEAERARRQAARAQAPTFEEKMRKATATVARPSGTAAPAEPDSQEDSLNPVELPAPKSAVAVSGSGSGIGDEARQQERDAKLAEAVYAPEKIGRLSVILCALALGVFFISMVVVFAGGAWMLTGMAVGEKPSFFSGAIMSFGVCAFGFSPLCALCGFFLGVHSLLRSRHTRVWGALGVVLNGLLMVPPMIMFLVLVLGR